MTIRTPITAIVAALLLFPGGASAGKRQAWDVQAVSGSYTITGTTAEEIGCPGDDSTPRDQVLASTYDVSFTGRDVGGRGPWIKYFPYLRGPASPGPVGVKFAVNATGKETKRALSFIGEPECAATDETCEESDTANTGKGAYAIGAKTSGKSVEVGLPIIGASSFLVSCNGDNSLSHSPFYNEHYSGGSISPFIAEKVPLTSFQKGSLVITFKGSKPVKGEGRGVYGWSGKLTWSAKLKLKKVVLAEGCKELKGASGFVCTP